MRKQAITDWKLCGFWPYHPLLGQSLETQKDLEGVTPWIPVQVPGGIYQALFAAGIIEDPYYGFNSLKCEWVANRWWIYKTTFPYRPAEGAKQVFLLFEGIDYEADILLNGKAIATHKGMYLPCKVDVSASIRRGDNLLTVMFRHPPEEMGQIGYTSQTFTQKARFNYKWDFSTRMVNVGLYKGVYLLEQGALTLEDIHVLQRDALAGDLCVEGRIGSQGGEWAKVTVECRHNRACVCRREMTLPLDGESTAFSIPVAIDRPALWYPNGLGEQPLYCFDVTVHDQEGYISDCFSIETGLRKIEYRKNEHAPEDSLAYTVVINNLPVYIKGVNMVPLDMEYGTVTAERYEKLVLQMKEANINLVRVWGGGLIEDEEFYRLCDRHGLMVWQEFIQSSSGLDNVPSQKPEFLALLQRAAETAVKTIRNHGCHVFWCGGNELQKARNKPVTAEDPNIRLLAEIVERYDPGKQFLPTSAYGPREFLNIDFPGENYDVHGPWKYEGVRREYEVFNASDSLLHSEFGCDGLTNAETIRAVLPGEECTRLDGRDSMWRHHGEWWNTWERDCAIFGRLESLEDFAAASQFIQATALQYAVEANRSRAFQNSGSIIWQVNEPWPSTSGTFLIDYFSRPKQAYYFVKSAFRPVHASLWHEALVFRPGEIFRGSLRIHNDTAKAVRRTVSITIKSDGEETLFHRCYPDTLFNVPCEKLEDFAFPVPACKSMEAVVDIDGEGGKRQNRYLLLVEQENGLCSLEAVKKYLDARFVWC